MNTLSEIKINDISVSLGKLPTEAKKKIFQIHFWKWPIVNETGKQKIYEHIALWADYFLQNP